MWNTETGTLWPLEAELLDVLGRVRGLRANDVEADPRVDALLERVVLTVVVDGTDDPLDDLLSAPRDPSVEKLVELRGALSRARGLESAAVMAETERVVATIAPLSSLDLGAALEAVLDQVLTHAPESLWVVRSRRFVPSEHGFRDALNGELASAPPEIVDVLMRLELPAPLSELAPLVSAVDARALLDAGVLLLEGQSPLPTTGRLESRFARQVTALLSAGLPSPHRERVEALRDAWPLDGFVHSSAKAMGRLTHLLEGAQVATLKTDRSFFIEDTSRDATLELGQVLSTRLSSSLESWFQLAGYISWLNERHDDELMRSLLRLGEAAPWPAFLSRLRAARRSRQRERVLEGWLGLPSPAQDTSPLRFKPRDDGRVELSLEALPAAYVEWARDKRLITELDLMLSGPDGLGQWVVNEAHAMSAEGLPLVTMFPHAQPDERVAAMVGRGLAQQLFGPGVVVPDASVHSKQSEAILRVLGDARIAVSGQRGPWFPPWMTAIDAGAVVVSRTARGLEVVHEGVTCPFASADFCSGPFRLVGYLPEDLGALAASALGETTGQLGARFRPDVCMGNLTLARGSLEVDVHALASLVSAKSEQALSAEGDRLSRALGLPRFVYVKLGGKPFLVDWSSLFSLEVFVSELRGATGTASFSKMDPPPEALWLELPDGRFTSELRFVAVSDGPECPLGRDVA